MNIFRFYYFIIYLSFIHYCAFSQEVNLSLKGRVIDKKTKKPISGALVKLTKPNGGFIRVKTNAEGMYVFDKEENHKLIQPGSSYIVSVSALNYAFGEAVKVHTKGLTGSQEIIKNLELTPFGKARAASVVISEDEEEEEEDEEEEEENEDKKKNHKQYRFK